MKGFSGIQNIILGVPSRQKLWVTLR